ncbi:DUF805 domain-containing protein [Chitinimonas lacunae]|uniref:DUF805 domain-containing protein n=1 Tax=Chitinimonas lacunae TaxID=1963018 RepID=A0ABV8MNK1_9NEIS
MARDGKVRLVFAGEILPGHEVAGVKQRLAELLKISAEQAERLFSGSPVTIKKSLPVSQVSTYVELLGQAGARIRVEPLEEAVVATEGHSRWPAVAVDREEPPPPWRQAEPPPPPAVAEASAPVSQSALIEEPVEEVDCPQCGMRQPKRTLCRSCGVDMPRFLRAKLEVRRDQENPPEVLRRIGAVAETIESGTPMPLGWSFDGRIGRVRYWTYGFVALAAVMVPLALIAWQQALFGSAASFLLLFGIGWVALTYLSLRMTAHRLHDIGFSGWWSLTLLLPYIGLVPYLVLLFWPGNEKENDYGLPPDVNTPAVMVGAAVAPVLAIFLSVVAVSAVLPLIGKHFQQLTPEQQQEAREAAVEELVKQGMTRPEAEVLVNQQMNGAPAPAGEVVIEDSEE